MTDRREELAADAAAVGQPAADEAVERAASLWSDAWDEMRRNPLFWVCVVLIVVVAAMAAAPQLFTQADPGYCNLSMARQGPSAEHPFGLDIQGCDVYARTIHGARASVLVGILATLVAAVVGGAIGTISAYFGGWLDAVLSGIGGVFLAIPILLGGIVILYSIPTPDKQPLILQVLKVVMAITVLGWPSLARIMRSSVLQVKPNEYVLAARALGASPLRVIVSHILPNSLAAIIVVATINLGQYIALEATLSFLGIGLRPPAYSWGQAISEASGLGYIVNTPHMLLFPSLFLSLTVLSFIMLGEVVRDALDPKLR